jgi:inorganic phosphate transporter, PiT family
MAHYPHGGKTAHEAEAADRICAEGGAAASILATFLKLPVSITHATAGANAGVGAVQRVKAVRWGVASNILWAWILTIPASALCFWLFGMGLHLIMPHFGVR